MNKTPVAPRTISFTAGTTDAQALAQLDGLLDDIDAANVRVYAETLFESEPDIDQAEFQSCLAQYRAFLQRWRDEHREEMDAKFEQLLAAARRASRGGVR